MSSHDDIREALASATPGPWDAKPLGSEGYAVTGAPDPDAHGVRAKMRRRIARFGYQDWDTDRANAELVANAPTWLAELLAEVDRLTRWQTEATEVMRGLQDLGKALSLPLGERITGSAAVVAAAALRYRIAALNVALQDEREAHGAAIARAEAAEQAIQLVRELHTPEVAYDSEHHDCEPSECDRACEGKPYERCAHCSGFAWEQLWPCSTISALDGGEQHG